jgi:LacI family gluconate utilization system Gnt-I transcriptional repressor
MQDGAEAIGRRRGSSSGGMAAVAAHAGVTPITVSRALRQPHLVSAATRERIQRSIEALGFIPNRLAGSLRSGSSRVVAAVVPNLRGAVFGRSLEGLTVRLAEHGLRVLTGSTGFDPRSEEDLIREVLGWRPLGLVVIGHSHTAATTAMLKRQDVPLVELMEFRTRPIDMCVGYSQRAAAAALTRHLYDRGRRRIGFSYITTRDNDRARSRWRGYREAIAALGLTERSVEASGLTFAEGAATLRRLLEAHPDLDAIFFGSDLLAVGALQECHRRGIRVPHDVALCGFDGLDIVEDIYPSLTTLASSGYEIGTIVADMLVGVVQGRPPARRAVDIGFQIVQRESS